MGISDNSNQGDSIIIIRLCTHKLSFPTALQCHNRLVIAMGHWIWRTLFVNLLQRAYCRACVSWALIRILAYSIVFSYK